MIIPIVCASAVILALTSAIIYKYTQNQKADSITSEILSGVVKLEKDAKEDIDFAKKYSPEVEKMAYNYEPEIKLLLPPTVLKFEQTVVKDAPKIISSVEDIVVNVEEIETAASNIVDDYSGAKLDNKALVMPVITPVLVNSTDDALTTPISSDISNITHV